MKKILLLLFIALTFSSLSQAQTNYFVFGVKSMRVSSDNPDVSKNKSSLGLDLGFGKNFKNKHWAADLTVFNELLTHRYYVFQDHYHEGSILSTGLALSPYYCINPAGDFQFSFSMALKVGHNFSIGDVSSKNIPPAGFQPSGAFSESLAPCFSVNCPLESTSIGVDLGYNTANLSTGLNKFRSGYYRSFNYNPGYVFVGLFVRLNAQKIKA